MSQWLTLWRAARLVGTSRGVLQKRIRDGELQSNDGMVSTEALLAIYPDVDLESSGAFENVVRIKEHAFARRVFERALPTQEVLAQRLFEQSQELANVRAHLQRYHALVIALQARIRANAVSPAPDAVRALAAFAESGLAEVLATESPDVLAIMDNVLTVMSAQVRVRPSGREFPIEGRDTLLQAGLRAGLRLNYGCSNGTCGLCKARVVSGSVAPVRPHGYALSEAEQAQGYALLCTHTAASSELEIEALEARSPRDIPCQQLAGRVRSVTPLGRDTMHLHLQTPAAHRLRFLAGQSITLGGSFRRDDAEAAYYAGNCPCDERNLHFYVARDADDRFAQRLFAGIVGVGDAVRLSGPHGDFVLREGQTQLVFVACDTGFAPVKSLIEQALAIDAAETLSCYWLATHPDGHFFANQCRAWDEAIDQFDYSLHANADPVAGAQDLVSAIQIDRFVMQCDFYVAGPADFVAAVVDGLSRMGVRHARIAVAPTDGARMPPAHPPHDARPHALR